ncbi:MAG TPA: hydrogenase maturation protease [Candidatus Limnocylindrales bacterium]
MTATRPSGSGRGRSPATWRGTTVAVEILICGSSDRGDDGAPILACELLRAALPKDVRLRTVGMLDIDDLLSIGKGAGVVIVDAATGIDAGVVVELPLSGPSGLGTIVQPRSSHALAIPEVVGLAEMIRGRPLDGRIVAIGGSQFGLGRALSKPVALALPTLARTVLEAIDRVRPAAVPAPGRS